MKHFILLLFIASISIGFIFSEKVNTIQDKPIYGDSVISYETLTTDVINNKIIAAEKKGEQWVKSPIEIVLKYVKYPGEEFNLSIDELPLDSYENPEKLQITITEEYLKDDSVFGIKYVFTMEKNGDLWKVKELKCAYKCQENRGHQIYNGQPCK